jgi:hypothetical protein
MEKSAEKYGKMFQTTNQNENPGDPKEAKELRIQDNDPMAMVQLRCTTSCWPWVDFKEGTFKSMG